MRIALFAASLMVACAGRAEIEPVTGDAAVDAQRVETESVDSGAPETAVTADSASDARPCPARLPYEPGLECAADKRCPKWTTPLSCIGGCCRPPWE